MEGGFSFCVGFSGLTIRFLLPTPLVLPQSFAALRCEDTENPDAQYHVVLLTTPLSITAAPVHRSGVATIYPTDEGWLRVYSALTAADGCQVACLLRPNGRHTLYYPASGWEHYRSDWHCTHLLGGEAMLLQHHAFLLHSSVVMLHGKAVLFCGASGAGKSTQAALWEQYANAKIINGDRCVVMQRPDGFYGGGSLWCGTAATYHPEQAPIAGIILLRQGDEETIRPMGFEAFSLLLRQMTVNSWDPQFMAAATDLLCRLTQQVPVYELECRPCRDAVALSHRTLFGKELDP